MKYILTNFLLIVLFSYAQAGNFTVSNVTQFQTALNTAASNGQNDTINVLAGTYNINPVLTFLSNENYFILIRGTGSPVLDGGNLRQVMYLTTTSNNAGIFIDGLTVQHGRADYGGGLNLQTQGGANITISNCIINDNVSNYVSGGANMTSNTGNITVTNCSFSRNSSPNTMGYPYGNAGGLFIQTDGAGTTIRMSGCTFNDNNAQRDAAGAMLYPLGSNSTVIAESNTFTYDTARESGGGCWIRGPGGNTTVRYFSNTLTGNASSTGGNGGGTYIQVTSGVVEVFNNTHTGNRAIWEGGAIWIEHSGGTLNIHRNKFTNNSSGISGGGANLFLDYGLAKIDHNIFNGNQSSGPGGGINLSTNTGNLNIFNNTFYSNTSTDGGDVNIYFDNASSASNFYNNILYNSTLPALTYSGMQTVTARYSNIQGGAGQPWFGTGCIDVFPWFVNSANNDFHLQDSIHCGSSRYSRCIDAGNPALQDSIINCTWGLGLIRSDMGVYGGKDLNIGINIINTNIPEKYVLHQNYPNPFNPTTKIKFNIPQKTVIARSGATWQSLMVTLKVFDITGREIATLVNEPLNPGTYEVTFDGSNLPSGIYFYQLKTDNFLEAKKVILLK